MSRGTEFFIKKGIFFLIPMELKEDTYWVNGIFLKVRETGPADGRIILFLHGFPEFWYGWRKQIAYFAEKGYRVVVPDQRGYNESSKPEGIKAYHMQNLVKDIAELIGQLGQQKVILVGHDWGGAVGWNMAAHYAHLLEKLIVLNLPHPLVFLKTLRSRPKQMLKSWYIGFFQLPWLPEKANSAANFKLLSENMQSSSKPGTFPPEIMAEYKKAWQHPGALRAMINWYRAIRYGSLKTPSKVKTPTLLIWGKKDIYLSHEMARPSIDKCSNGRLVMIEDATHWVQHEKAEEVNRLIEEFVGEKS